MNGRLWLDNDWLVRVECKGIICIEHRLPYKACSSCPGKYGLGEGVRVRY
ncbi:hypothetical protein HY640_00460 [Candidatus Woesearchaeota archaeon]|nr:hypothetical protein [Candidatus Woesearchaeota archaeon]